MRIASRLSEQELWPSWEGIVTDLDLNLQPNPMTFDHGG